MTKKAPKDAVNDFDYSKYDNEIKKFLLDFGNDDIFNYLFYGKYKNYLVVLNYETLKLFFIDRFYSTALEYSIIISGKQGEKRNHKNDLSINFIILFSDNSKNFSDILEVIKEKINTFAFENRAWTKKVLSGEPLEEQFPNQ